MTMPANNIPTEPEELPPPEFVLLVTDNLDPEKSDSKGPTAGWVIGKPHPFMPSMIIARMIVSHNAIAVYVYSTARDGSVGARNIIPMSRVRFTHERMALDVMAEEINLSLDGEDPYIYDDDDDEGDEPESTPGDAAVTQPPNGQPSP